MTRAAQVQEGIVKRAKLMRFRLARLEAQEIQRQRNAAQWATVARLGNLLDARHHPIPR